MSSEDPSTGSRHPSPLWLLAVLPVGLLIGWAVAQLPGPSVQPVPATSPTLPANAEPQGARVHPGAAQPVPAAPQRRRAELSQWTSFAAAVEESKGSGRPILIDFNADWCGPCQAMKHQVFEDGTLGPLVQSQVVPVSIVDRTREAGSNPEDVERLMQQFQVEAFPTLVVFSPRTGRAIRTQGFGGPEATVAWIEEAARRVK